MYGSPEECVVCSGTSSVVVAVAHNALRKLTVELLERDRARWQLRAVVDQPELAAAVGAAEPDLVILDARDFARCCCDSLHAFPRRRVIVIVPEPNAAYGRAAQRAGAGAWLTRDRVGEDLSACMRRVLGCTHGPARGRGARPTGRAGTATPLVVRRTVNRLPPRMSTPARRGLIASEA